MFLRLLLQTFHKQLQQNHKIENNRKPLLPKYSRFSSIIKESIRHITKLTVFSAQLVQNSTKKLAIPWFFYLV